MKLSRRQFLGKTALSGTLLLVPPCRAAGTASGGAAAWPMAAPPLAPRIAHVIRQLGRVRDDPYAWMKFVPERGTRELATLPAPLRGQLTAEIDYARAMLGPLEPRRTMLLEQMMAHVGEAGAAPELTVHGWQYYDYVPAGGVHAIHARRPATGGNAQILVDNALRAAGHPYYRATDHQPSPDQRYFAWAEDVIGNDRHLICVRDNQTGETRVVVPEDAYGYGGLVFSPSSQLLFWIWRDAFNRPKRVYRTPVGGGPGELVYEETNPAIFMRIGRTAADGFVAITLSGPDTSEVRLISAAHERAEPKVVFPRRDKVLYEIDEWNGRLVMLTDADGALDNKIVSLPRDGFAPSDTLVPHRAGHLLLQMMPFKRALARLERADGLHRLVILPASGKEMVIAFPGEAYALTLPPGQDYAAEALRIVHQAPDAPRAWIDVSLADGRQTLVAQDVIPGFSPADYVVERLAARAPDGELVPLTVLSRRGAPRDGSAPLLLYGYGAYGVSSDPEFSIPAIVLVDQGWRYAIAHVRGGSEKGRRWFLEGRKFNKRNSFTDFIACAEHLGSNGYAARGRIVAYGLSAGGLLVGASMNMAPELWGGVIAKVPFVDMLNTMSDADHPLVPLFRPDWGDPLADPAAYDYIASISPYENVRAAPYPPLLCTAGLKDDRVSYWEPAKLVAEVRRRSTSGNPAILLLDTASGHQGSGNLRDELSQLALFWAFAEQCVAARDRSAR